MLLVLLLLLVRLTEVSWGVEVHCPAPCICNKTAASCDKSALTNFPEKKFPSSLLELDFSRNNITKIEEFTIRKWMIVSLAQLNLSNNAISTINENSLMAQSALEKLDLSGNNIKNIPLKTFAYCPRLQWLSLANNREIQVSEDAPLLESDSLQVLHLEHCNLRNVSVVNFEGIVNLQELYISHNKIESISSVLERPVQSLVNIKILDLSYNLFQHLPTQKISLPNIEKLDLGNNKVKYLCETEESREVCETNFPTETGIASA
jgi:Leucine-rich repeat (LRR) protein